MSVGNDRMVEGAAVRRERTKFQIPLPLSLAHSSSGVDVFDCRD